MKKTILSLIVLSAFAGLTFAQTQQTPAQTEKPKAEEKAPAKKAVKPEVFTGKISSIDNTKNEIVVKNAKNEKTFSVDPKEINNYKVGDKVKVTVKGDKTEIKVIKEAKKEKKEKKVEAKVEKTEAPKATTPAPAANPNPQGK